MTEKMMRAAVLTGAGKLMMKDVPVPEPGPGEVLVRLEGCGVCASNLTPWSGPEWMEFPTQPGALGHEGWGIIEKLGDGVTGLEAGERVGMLSGNAYAECDLAKASEVVKLPDGSEGMDMPLEPFGCAFNIFRRSDIHEGDDVAIIGIGFLGAILVKLASEAGARVIAISRREESLALARRMGATQAIPMHDHREIVDRVGELTGEHFCDRVIEAVGKQWPLDLAAELTREGGRLVIAGYHQDGPRQVNMQLWNWRGFDVVNAHERDAAVAVLGMREAAAAIEKGRLDPRMLITHRFPLERLGEALDAARDRPGNFIKAVVRP
ncbi:MAG TPA: zinc-binding dehydrogenase [Sphingomicrobium sp.]|nr:zinc-binding dehydrogenase [Sphingomicrobium sp.]